MRGWAALVLGALALAAVGSGCAEGDAAEGPATGGKSGGGAGGMGASAGTGGFVPSGGGIPNQGGSPSTGGTPNQGGGPSTGGTPSTGGGAGSGGTTATGGTTSTGGAAGSGGTTASGGTGGDAGSTWPTCDTQPTSVPTKTIKQIWTDNPSTATEVWVAGAYVAAVSGGGCTAGSSCQLFIQADPSYPNLTQAAKNGVNVRVSGTVSTHFTGIVPGDRVNVRGWAVRSTFGGGNELVIQVNASLPGCIKKIGTGNLTPLAVQLSDLTVNAYETTHGPMLVSVSNVTGKPAGSTEIFGIWATGVGIGDAGPAGIPNVSPYFLSGGAFTGLPTTGQTPVDFTSVTGVFAVYVPFTDGGAATKYVVLYPRTMAEIVKK